jgi:glycerol uptake facilitator-like aquaporin
MMITGNIPWALGASYIVAQLFGSVVGAGILSSVVGTKFTGNLQLGMNISTAQGFAIEMAMTFVLVFVVFR